MRAAVTALISGIILLTAVPCGSGARAQIADAPEVSGVTKVKKALRKKEEENEWDIDSDGIFGFTKGSDMGKAGEKGGEIDSIGAFRNRGNYAINATKFEYSYVAAENFQIAPSVSIGRYDISGLPEFDDRHSWTFNGMAFEIKRRLLDRDKAQFGLTIGLEPRWSPVNPVSGARAHTYTAELVVAADKELVKNRLFGGINLIYEPGAIKDRDTGEWEKFSTLGFSGALATPLSSSFTIGAEVRYFLLYEGMALNTFAGDALFVGPNVWAKLPNKLNLTAALNLQVAGRTIEPTSLHRINLVRLKLAKEF